MFAMPTVDLSFISLLAHQGGWDEILMVVVPVALFAALLAVANRRATNLARDPHDGTSTTTEPEPRNERGGPT